MNGEKSDKNEEAQKIIINGISKLDGNKVRHCESTKEVVDKVQCLYGGDSHVAQEKAEDPYCSRNQPKHGEVVAHRTHVNDEDVS